VPSFKPKGLWEAKPHTQAKIEIIRQYLVRWFQILGRSGLGSRLVYIDGFAGPGKYKDGLQGSPIAALEAAKAAILQAGAALKAKEFCFLFVEKEPEFAEHLRSLITEQQWPPEIKWEVQQGTFDEQVGSVLEDLKTQRQSLAPTFAFIDPFGATGLPFRIVAEILSYPSCEVLLNLDSDGIGRLVTAQALEKNQSHLDEIFGDKSWQSELNPNLPMAQLSARVLALYKKKLRSLPKVRYVFAFAMNSRDGLLNYHLVFASQNPKGLEKMKEAMRAVDQSGAYSFSDDTVGQTLLPFNYAAPELWAMRMHQAMVGRPHAYDEFHDFALNETPFLNPKAMLECLKKLGKVEVQWLGEPPRSGFPAKKIKAILLNP
jgi:three-Cys-motif partner protein